MTFDEAMAECRKGKKVRDNDSMQKGWSVFYIRSGNAKGYYCLNPHTSSNYQFRPSDENRASTDWRLLS